MAIQMRIDKPTAIYNPARDVAYNFPEVVQMVAARIESQNWQELQQLVSEKGVTDQDVGDVLDCLVRIVQRSNEAISLPVMLKQEQWNNLKPEAKFVVLSHLGFVFLGMFYNGVRESSLGPDGRASQLVDFLRRSENSTNELMFKPKSILQRLRAAWHALRG